MRTPAFDRSGGLFVAVFFVIMFKLSFPATFFNAMNLLLRCRNEGFFSYIFWFQAEPEREIIRRCSSCLEAIVRFS